MVLGIILFVVGLLLILFSFYWGLKLEKMDTLWVSLISVGVGLMLCSVIPMNQSTPQFDLQGCIQQCSDIPLEVGGFECFTCCGKQYINKPMIDMCKQAIWPFLNDAAKEEILKKQPEKECNCHKEKQ